MRAIKYETFVTTEGIIKKLSYHDKVFKRVYSKRNNGAAFTLIKDEFITRAKEIPVLLLEAVVDENEYLISNAIERCLLSDVAVNHHSENVVLG